MIKEYLNKSFHRNLLEKLIKENASLIKGKILDIGSGSRRYDHLFNGKITAVDTKPNPAKNIIKGDMHNLQFPDKSFDSIVSIEVICYSSDFKKALNEISRVTKNDAVIMLSIPFLVRDSFDRIRFTQEYFNNLLNEYNFKQFSIQKFGNSATIIWDILRTFISSRKSKFVKRIFIILFIPYLLMVKLLKLHKIIDNAYYSGLFIIINK